jgi:phosphomannomutase
MTPDPSHAEYRCPGEIGPISRAVHLGRLAGFHPACRQCDRRDDTAGLSLRQIRQLAELASQARRPPLFCSEGVGNVAINDLSPGLARRIAVEFAKRLVSPAAQAENRPPAVVVGSDGRLATAAIIAAIVEGIRWTGGEAIDIGPASVPCTARTIQHLAAGGGVFVGNSGGAPHTVGLKFWTQAEPLSRGGLLDDIAASLQNQPAEATIDRPTRAFGPLRRFAAADIYLSDLRPAYHALRPLRFVLDCAAKPVVAYLEDLMRNVACQIIPAETAECVRHTPCAAGNGTRSVPDTLSLGEQVAAAQAHFGMWIGDDGEDCQVVDERGQAVEAERLAGLIAESLASPVLPGEELRQQTFLRMRESRATLAVDRTGRLWYAADHPPWPDALQTLTLLLVLLSHNDRALSAVLNLL